VIAVVISPARGELAARRSRRRQLRTRRPATAKTRRRSPFGSPLAALSSEGDHLYPGGGLAARATILHSAVRGIDRRRVLRY
jgi:hypothetical protein